MDFTTNKNESQQLNPMTPNEPFGFRRIKRRHLLEKDIVITALKQAFVMLRPDIMWKNPVMFVVEVGTFLTLVYIIKAAFGGTESQLPMRYFISLEIWLFLTLLFGNFATALAEARGKAQADSLRRIRRDTVAYRLSSSGKIEEISSMDLKRGDKVVVVTG